MNVGFIGSEGNTPATMEDLERELKRETRSNRALESAVSRLSRERDQALTKATHRGYLAIGLAVAGLAATTVASIAAYTWEHDKTQDTYITQLEDE